MIFRSSSTAFEVGNGEHRAAITDWKAEKRANFDAYKTGLENYRAARSANKAIRKVIAAKFKSDVGALSANTQAAIDSVVNIEVKKARSEAS